MAFELLATMPFHVATMLPVLQSRGVLRRGGPMDMKILAGAIQFAIPVTPAVSWPDGHGVHDDELTALKVLTGQALNGCPGEQNDPEIQEMKNKHDVPAVQAVGAAVPPAQKRPSGHKTQLAPTR